MTLALLDPSQRILVTCIAAICMIAAFVLRRFRDESSWFPALFTVSLVGLSLLASEFAVTSLFSASLGADFNDYRWTLLSPWGRIGTILGVSAVVVVMILSWLSTSRIASPWRRSAVILLRTGAACSALVVFLEPAIEMRMVAREPNRIAILVDDSKSMSLRDNDNGPTRAELARSIIEESQETFESWRDRHSVEVFRFSDELQLTGIKDLTRLKADGKSTRVRNALEQIRSRYEGKDLAGVVLLSDGVFTDTLAETAAEGDAKEFVSELDTKVHTVWTGKKGLKDVSVATILSDEFSFVRTAVRIECIIRTTGYGARKIPVTLSRDGEDMRRQWVELAEGSAEAKVAFEFTPRKTGRYVYEISTPVSDDEAVTTNNSRSFVMRVIRDKIRVLQVAGQPSWDVRALRGMLKQDPNIDLISFFILRTRQDIQTASDTELSLIRFPTRELFEEELPSFDLIFMQNFNYGPYSMHQYLDNIRRYVQGGGGLVMLGGGLSFSSGFYAGTPLANALPVKLPPSTATPILDETPFQAKLSKIGKTHPITSLRYSEGDNINIWNALPMLEGVNFVRGPKQDASVLVEHPSLRDAEGNPRPVVVSGEYGEGRSLAVLTDSLWQWSFHEGEQANELRAYQRFWENAIRWTIQDPELRYLRIESDKVEYEPGSNGRLEIILFNHDYTPKPGALIDFVLTRSGRDIATEEVMKLTLETNERGHVQVEMANLAPGSYLAHASVKLGDKRISSKEIFLVRAASSELSQPEAQSQQLKSLATWSGGSYLGQVYEIPTDLPFLEPRIVRIDRSDSMELWNRPWILLLALLFFGLEWTLRRRSGYL